MKKRIFNRIISVIVFFLFSINLLPISRAYAKSDNKASASTSEISNLYKKQLKKLYKSYKKMKKEIWQAYYDHVKKFGYENDKTYMSDYFWSWDKYNTKYAFKYSLNDIDSDGVDEILISGEYGDDSFEKGFISDYSLVKIYKYTNGKFKQIFKETISISENNANPIQFYDNYKYIVTFWITDYVIEYIYKFNGKKYKKYIYHEFQDSYSDWYKYDKKTRELKKLSQLKGESYYKKITSKKKCSIKWKNYS